MLQAVILAAGASARMGRSKALIKMPNGNTWLAQVARVLPGVPMVITGAERAAVETEACALQLKAVYNENFSTGLMSSVQTAVRACDAKVTALLIALVDQPELRALEVDRLVTGWRESGRSLARPVDEMGRPGHPCIIARAHFAELLAQPLVDQGASFLFARYPEQVFALKLNTPFAFLDLDTPQEWETHLAQGIP